MSATFGCPYCGATYPVKPVLVGRPVRCTTCKNAFRLRADGIADKVESAAPAPAAVTTQASEAPAKPPTGRTEAPRPPTGRTEAPARPPTGRTAAPPAAPAVAPVTPPPRAVPPRTTRTSLNSAQEEARRSLAANLSSIAEQALKAEEKKQSSDRLKRHSDRLARQQSRGEGGVGDIGPAVLTGYGQREHHEKRLWALGCAGAVALIAAIVWLSHLSSAERDALRAFTDPVDAAHNSIGRRKAAIVDRAWLTTVPPLVDVSDARIGSRRTVPMAGAKPVLGGLAGLTLVADKGVWAPAEKAGELAKRWDAKKDAAANAKALAKDGITIVPVAELKRRLADEGGLDQDEAEELIAFFTAPTDVALPVAKRLAAGETPDALQFTVFHGGNGELLVDLGGTYKRKAVEYEGRLLRFVGAGWPGEWRIVWAKTHSRDQ